MRTSWALATTGAASGSCRPPAPAWSWCCSRSSSGAGTRDANRRSRQRRNGPPRVEAPGSLAKLSNADVPKRQRSRVVALHPQMAARRAPVVGPDGELARLDAGGPVGAAELVLEQFDAVQPVLDMRTFRDDACRVPFADPLQMTLGGRVHGVRGAGAGEPRLVVLGMDVVEELILGRAPVDVVVLLGAAVEDAAVTRLADLPVHLELEVAEFVLRHDVGDRPVLGQRAVDNVPAGGHLVGLVSAPVVQGGPVKERPPGHSGWRMPDGGLIEGGGLIG